MDSHPGDNHYDLLEKSSQQHEFVECNETIKTEVKDEPLDDDDFDETLHYAFSSNINEEPKIKTEIKEENLEEDVDNTLPHYSTDLNIKEETDRISEASDTSGEKKHSCDICFKTFKKPSQVKIHKRTHTGEKPYQCSDCDRSFAHGKSLRDHMKRHTILEKNHICSICEKAFTLRSALKTHIRTHTKPFQCTLCNHSTSTKSDLNKHMRVHTREKPYMCSICSRCFAERKTLKQHMNTHGIKAYNCSVCEAAFTNKLDLYDHMKCHTGDKHYPLLEKSSQLETISEIFGESVESQKVLQEAEFDETLICYSTGMNEYNIYGEKIEKKDPISEEIVMKSDKGSVGDLSCDQCGKSFKDIGMLNVHKWIHN